MAALQWLSFWGKFHQLSGDKMPIATISEFALRGITYPIRDFYMSLYGYIETLLPVLPPSHRNFIYSVIALSAWLIKLLAAIAGETARNSTLTSAFNDTLHTLSLNSNNFFGNYSAKTGMSYIAKHAYYNLINNSTLAEDLTTKGMRAINSTIRYVLKAFEFL